jgi:hypothetical protein
LPPEVLKAINTATAAVTAKILETYGYAPAARPEEESVENEGRQNPNRRAPPQPPKPSSSSSGRSWASFNTGPSDYGSSKEASTAMLRCSTDARWSHHLNRKNGNATVYKCRHKVHICFSLSHSLTLSLSLSLSCSLAHSSVSPSLVFRSARGRAWCRARL